MCQPHPAQCLLFGSSSFPHSLMGFSYMAIISFFFNLTQIQGKSIKDIMNTANIISYSLLCSVSTFPAVHSLWIGDVAGNWQALLTSFRAWFGCSFSSIFRYPFLSKLVQKSYNTSPALSSSLNLWTTRKLYNMFPWLFLNTEVEDQELLSLT